MIDVGECPECHYLFEKFMDTCPKCGKKDPMPDGIYLRSVAHDDLQIRRVANAIRAGKLTTGKPHGQ